MCYSTDNWRKRFYMIKSKFNFTFPKTLPLRLQNMEKASLHASNLEWIRSLLVHDINVNSILWKPAITGFQKQPIFPVIHSNSQLILTFYHRKCSAQGNRAPLLCWFSWNEMRGHSESGRATLRTREECFSTLWMPHMQFKDRHRSWMWIESHSKAKKSNWHSSWSSIFIGGV